MAGLTIEEKISPLKERRPYDFEAAHRRLAWMFRLAVFLTLFLGMALGMAVHTISTLLPLKTTEYALLRADPADDRIYRVEPLSREVEGYDLFVEATIRRLTRVLLSVDAVTSLTEIPRALELYGTREFARRFHDMRSASLKEDIKADLSRSIVIEGVELLAEYGGQDRRYAVNVIQIDKRKGKLISKHRRRASLHIRFQPHTVREQDKFNNPHGLRLVNLTLQEQEDFND